APAEAGAKRHLGVVGGRRQTVNPLVAVVGVVIRIAVLARIPGSGVERTTGDRATRRRSRAVIVRDQWIAVIRGAAIKTFVNRPAIVGSGYSFVDFLPGVLAHVVDMHAAVDRMEIKGKRISQAHHPDRLVEPGGLREKRIIPRN